MKEPNWAKVLAFLYENDGKIILAYDDNNDDSNPTKSINGGKLANKLDMTNSNLYSSLDYLYNHNLVHYGAISPKENDFQNVLGEKIKSEQPLCELELEMDGFDVAHEREITKSQLETNRRSARLSGYLVVAIIIQSLITVTQHEGGREVILISLVILGLAFVVLIELNED